MENKTTFSEIKEKLKNFRDERDWNQFHTPKNLSMAISVEASELMEHFIWENNDEAKEKLKDKEKFQEIKNELADIFNFSFMMADELDVDIVEIIEEKIEENKKKYPPEKAKGTSKKYNELGDGSD